MTRSVSGAGASETADAEAGVVDAHVHVWPRGLVHPAQRDGVPLAAAPADLLEAMDAVGIARTIVSPAMVHADNGYVIGAAATVPDRLAAVAGLDPRDRGSAAALERHVAHGAVGVRFNPGARQLEGAEDEAAVLQLAEMAAELGVVVQWTIRLPYVGMLERVADRTDARQVLDHLGLPADARDLSQLGRMRAIAALPRTYVKLSGMYALALEPYPYRDVWPWAEGVVEAFGAERTMWASDWPLSSESASMAQQRALVDQLPFLEDNDRRLILKDTALSVWQRISRRADPPEARA